MTTTKNKRCSTCKRSVNPDVWDEIGFECSHVRCPNRHHPLGPNHQQASENIHLAEDEPYCKEWIMSSKLTVTSGERSNTGVLMVQRVNLFQGQINVVGSPLPLTAGETYDAHASHDGGIAYLVFELPHPRHEADTQLTGAPPKVKRR